VQYSGVAYDSSSLPLFSLFGRASLIFLTTPHSASHAAQALVLVPDAYERPGCWSFSSVTVNDRFINSSVVQPCGEAGGERR